MSFQELQKMVAALREENRHAQAPPRVEAALVAAFRAQANPRRRPRWIDAGLAAAAAVTVAIALGASWMARPVPPPPLPRAPLAKAPDPLPAPQMVARRAVKRASRPRVASKAQEEVTTQFLPLDDAVHLAPIESGQVVRVEVPRATLVRFGLPVNQERMMERIPADVVFGQEGIARAIRFVK